MIRANSEQLKHLPWFARAGAASSIVPIARFIGPNVFALKGGGYGCLFALSGIDEEGLTDQELDARMRSIEGALRGMPEGSCLYQYTRMMSGFDLPRQREYANPATQVFADDRLAFLEKAAGFRRIDLHWCLTLEPSKVKAFEHKPKEHAADTSRMLAELQKTASILEGHLGSAFGLRRLDKNATFQFFSHLFNLEEWAAADQLRSHTGVDRQIVKSPIAWHRDHIQVGKRHVQMFSLKMPPEASQPCLFSGLLTLDCDSVLCSTWRPKSTAAARSEINAQEKFISFFKVGILTRVMNGRDTASLETGAGARAANSNVDDLSEVIRSLDKKAQGEYSLRLLLAADSPEQLRATTPAVHRIFVDARAQVIEETLGNLSAFYAMFPGNRKFNVFPLWLSEEHHARLSSVFAPHLGHPHSEDLDAEYLNILETRSRTPFFQDVYVDGVRVMLILGPTGTGKSVHGNQIVALEQKYGGFSYIFDIGASYESVVELYGGCVNRIGKDGPRVNPFALEPTESNIKFLYSFIRLLLTNGGAELEPEDDDVIHKAVQDIYLLDPENRRLSNLFLPRKLDRYLSKWVGKGIYNAIFDNAEDSLSLSRLQCFDLLMGRAKGIILDETLQHAADELSHTSTLIGAALHLLTEDPENRKALNTSLSVLTRVLNAVNWDKISKGHPDAWLYFYEEFLAIYDNKLRKLTGSYYTPPEVVGAMVSLVDEVLRSPRFGLHTGLASPAVTIADPAAGTGTFILGILRRIAKNVAADQGDGAVPDAIHETLKRIIAFEMQLGPFAVAQLRILAEVLDLTKSPSTQALRMFVTNTLGNPDDEEGHITGLIPRSIAQSRRDANRIKRDETITVVIGNPPYKEKAKGKGGWVEGQTAATAKSAPLNAWQPPAVWGVGAHAKHLRNLYVYFWRWATWKVFDPNPFQPGSGPRDGIVCFITVSGFLNGPGFQRMREYLRRTCDDIWVIDCSPEGHQPEVNTRIFQGVQQPVCIVMASRSHANN